MQRPGMTISEQGTIYPTYRYGYRWIRWQISTRELYDQTDEIEAYKRQSLFETSLEGMSDEEINSAINKIMSGDEYKDLPVGPPPPGFN